MTGHLLSRRRGFILSAAGLSALIIVLCILFGCIQPSGALLKFFQIVIPLAALALAVLVVSASGNFIRNELALIVAFTLLLVFGILVYADLPDLADKKWYVQLLMPLDNTLSLLFPSRGDYSGKVLDYKAGYWILHFLAYFVFAWFGFALLGRKIVNKLTLKFLSAKKCDILWGFSNGGRLLAGDILENGSGEEPVFVLDTEDADSGKIFKSLSDSGLLAVSYGERRLVKGRRHFFLTENQEYNTSCALFVANKLKSLGKKPSYKTHLYVRTELSGMDQFFKNSICGIEDIVEVHIVNQSDLTARQFVNAHHVLELCSPRFASTASVDDDIEILCLGLGWTGFEMLRKTVYDTRFPGKGSVRFTVIDKNFDSCLGKWKELFDYAEQFGIHITVNPLFEGKRVDTAGSSLFFDWLSDGRRILRFNRILTMLGDDSLNTSTALAIHRLRIRLASASDIQEGRFENIFAHVRGTASFPSFNSDFSPIKLFGGLEDIYTCRIVVGEALDKVAKLVNYVYCSSESVVPQARFEQDNASIEDEWARCSMFNRDSSRAVAMNVENTIRLAGGIDAFDDAVNNPELLEKLAAMEHERWNAFHIMKGIKEWPADEVASFPRNTRGKLYCGQQLVRHICLVPFDRLDAATEVARSLTGNDTFDFKEVDRRIVRHFGIFYQYLNLTV